MIAVQQAPLMPSLFNNHRRGLSAPVAPAIIAVLPTPTPGLLSLSRPRQQQQPRAPRQRPTPPAKQRSPPASPVAAPAVAVTPARAGPKEKPRSVSQPSPSPAPRKNRPASHQSPAPSPAAAAPRSEPAHRRGTSTSALSDPFIVSPAADAAVAAKPFKLPRAARRRPAREPESPTPAGAKPIPRTPARRPTLTLSRSLPTARGFPICDDNTDTEDDSPAPVTPIRLAFSGPGPAVAGDFFTEGFGPRTAPPTGTPGCPFDRFFSLEDERALKDRLFASSQFQNSPDPDDLPIPAFVRF